jgi:glucosamine kinase
MTEIVAAMDGGGTKTLVAWADRTGTVWRGRAELGCNPQDNPDWAATLSRALAQVPAASGAVLGLPGYGEVAALDAQTAAHIRSEMTLKTDLNTLILFNDVELAYHGAFPDGGGVLILAGTGSMAMARGAVGLKRVGGWGDLFGDEGSAFWIGQRGLQWASQMRDGRLGDTGFANRLSSKLKLRAEDGPFALSGWVLADPHPRSRIATVSRFINELSDEGDVTAQSILDQAAMLLADHALTVARRAALPDGWRWTQAGSVFGSKRLFAAVQNNLGRAPTTPCHDALGGGLWLAAKAAGWPVDADWAARVTAGLAAG